MKKVAVLLGVAGLLSLTGCYKEKMCRCAVLDNQYIRLISIKRGSCEDIRFFYYDLNGGTIADYQDRTDSVLCTDFTFASDPDNLYDNI